MKFLTDKKIVGASIVLLAVISIAYFFDKGLALGLGFIAVLSLITFFIFNKTGLKDRKIYWLFLIVFVIHLSITLGMYYAHFQPFSQGSGDYTLYQHQALQISDRLHHGNDSLQGLAISNFYPVVIGYIYALMVPSILIGELLNVWLAAISVIFIYLIILEIGGSSKSAFITGLLATMYPSYMFLSGLLLKDTMEICFIMLGLLLLIKIIKKFYWHDFLMLYLIFIITTNFRFYIGYALIATFVISWFLFSKIGIKKRMAYGLIFIIMLGFIPQIAAGQGYYGVNSFQKYLNYKTVNFYRQLAYMPLSTADSHSAPKAVATNSLPARNPWVSPTSTVGLGSSFVAENNPLGYLKSFVYALLGPFPWQIKNLRQSLALFETIPWYVLLFFIINGIIILFKKRAKEAAPLFIFSFIALIVIAIFDSNFGIIIRIRIPVFLSLLCAASFSFNEKNTIYNHLNNMYGKILSYGRNWFYREPLG